MRFLVVFGSGTGTNTNGIWPACAGSSAGGSINTSSVSSMVIGHPNATDQNRASARIGSTHDKMHETSRHLPHGRSPGPSPTTTNGQPGWRSNPRPTTPSGLPSVPPGVRPLTETSDSRLSGFTSTARASGSGRSKAPLCSAGVPQPDRLSWARYACPRAGTLGALAVRDDVGAMCGLLFKIRRGGATCAAWVVSAVGTRPMLREPMGPGGARGCRAGLAPAPDGTRGCMRPFGGRRAGW
jgi:hypothetical protein